MMFCRKNIVYLRQDYSKIQMQSIEERIITSIAKRGRGTIVSPLDYAGYGDSKAVQKAFERLTTSEKLIRVARGIYCYPKIDKVLGLGVLYPTFEEIAAAIARRDKAKIVPTGVYALNKLGLSTQLPMNVVYLTDGSPRKVRLDGERASGSSIRRKRIWLFKTILPCFSHSHSVKSERAILHQSSWPMCGS